MTDVPRELDVHLNQDSPNGISGEATTVEGDFVILLHNHGHGLHVHLKLDSDLAQASAIGSPNHFVPADTTRSVSVEADNAKLPVNGRLEVVTGYGAERAFIPVRIEAPQSARNVVEVDEALATPTNQTRTPIDSRETATVLGLGGVAVVLAILALVFIQDLIIFFGVLAVILSVVIAAMLVMQ